MQVPGQAAGSSRRLDQAVTSDEYCANIFHRRAAMVTLIDHEHRPFRLWREERAVVYSSIGMHMSLWYGARPSFLLIHTSRTPGTLSWDLVRFVRDIPTEMYDRDLEIDGDVMRSLGVEDIVSPPSGEDEEYEPEADVASTLNALPLVVADLNLHFTKRCMWKSEIDNLLLHRGSPYAVHLKGRTSDGLLVLERHGCDIALLWPRKISMIKDVLLSIITALESLHARGTIHRDLTPQNVLRGEDGSIILCDLECQLSSHNCRAPELWVEHPIYTAESDVYAFGTLMWKLCYLNNPRWLVFYELFPVPAPFDDIYRACLDADPKRRPALKEIRQSLLSITDA